MGVQVRSSVWAGPMIASVVVDWVVPAILFVLVVIAAWIGIRWTSSEELAALRRRSHRSCGAGRVGAAPSHVARHRLVTCWTEDTMAASSPHRCFPAKGRALKEVELRQARGRGK